MSDDEVEEVSLSPAGKVVQSLNGVSLEPDVVYEKLKVMEKKGPIWASLFTPVLAKKDGSRNRLCWPKCLRCGVHLSTSNISSRFTSHNKPNGCKAIKLQAIALPGAPTPTAGRSASRSAGGASSSGVAPIQVLHGATDMSAC